jgi:hypothetical protein
MNADNYGTLESCQALQAAGIVMETDCVWVDFCGQYELFDRLEFRLRYSNVPSVPAPSLAEMWRELPEAHMFKEKDGTTVAHVGPGSNPMFDINPTDALIHLAI